MGRDMIAELLTQNHGEYVFRIGAQPPHTALFTAKPADTADGWLGTERTPEQIIGIKEALENLVDEVGGKVSTPLFSRVLLKGSRSPTGFALIRVTKRGAPSIYLTIALTSSECISHA
jgi:hypothetical protein